MKPRQGAAHASDVQPGQVSPAVGGDVVGVCPYCGIACHSGAPTQQKMERLGFLWCWPRGRDDMNATTSPKERQSRNARILNKLSTS